MDMKTVVSQPGAKRYHVVFLRETDGNSLGRTLTTSFEKNANKAELWALIPAIARLGELFSKVIRDGQWDRKASHHLIPGASQQAATAAVKASAQAFADDLNGHLRDSGHQVSPGPDRRAHGAGTVAGSIRALQRGASALELEDEIAKGVQAPSGATLRIGRVREYRGKITRVLQERPAGYPRRAQLGAPRCGRTGCAGSARPAPCCDGRGVGEHAGACCGRLCICMPSLTLAVPAHHVTKDGSRITCPASLWSLHATPQDRRRKVQRGRSRLSSGG